jgi:hypothetical protein
MSPDELGHLSSTLARAQVILVVSALRAEAFEPLRGSAAAFLLRPVTIGEIAKRAAGVLSEGGPDVGER